MDGVKESARIHTGNPSSLDVGEMVRAFELFAIVDETLREPHDVVAFTCEPPGFPRLAVFISTLPTPQFFHDLKWAGMWNPYVPSGTGNVPCYSMWVAGSSDLIKSIRHELTHIALDAAGHSSRRNYHLDPKPSASHPFYSEEDVCNLMETVLSSVSDAAELVFEKYRLAVATLREAGRV